MYDPEKVEDWRAVEIYMSLDSTDIKWSFIDPLAYANAGKTTTFCPFVVVIGVKPTTVSFDRTVQAATVVEEMLDSAGFANVEVAVVEGVRERNAARGPELLPFNPLLDDIQRVLLLTCAHVARLPPVDLNTGTTITNTSQPREEIISPGSGVFDGALAALKAEIASHERSINAWNAVLVRLGDPAPGENPKVTRRRTEHQSLVHNAKEKIRLVNELFDEVQDRTDPDKRVIGFVLHCEPIEASVEARGRLGSHRARQGDDRLGHVPRKQDLSARTSAAQYGEIMWPQAADSADYQYPPDGLLQAIDVHLDVHNQKGLLAVKNGATTGTTFGRVNGLESFTRYGIEETSMKIAILNCDKDHVRFSKPGDSGSIVLDRTAKIIGVLTGGGGPADSTDRSYLTPYFDIH